MLTRAWRALTGRLERRSYTDALVAGLESRAAGAAVAGGLHGGLEIAAGAYARAFASSRIEPVNGRTAALSPGLLSDLARRMIREGEALYLIDVADGGAVSLADVDQYDVRGKRRPWTYRASVPQPSGAVTRTVDESGVIHCRYATRPRAPWAGVGPLEWARDSGALAAALEQRLGQEAAGPVGTLIPIPTDGGETGEAEDPHGKLKADIRELRGRVALVETTAAGWGAGRSESPRGDWQPMRLGADPPATLAQLRRDVEACVLACCGVPPGLASVNADGTAQREGWRRFLHGSVSPLARLVEAELTAKLELPIRLEFGSLYAADVVGRARAWRSLVGAKGEMDADHAARLVGLEVSRASDG